MRIPSVSIRLGAPALPAWRIPRLPRLRVSRPRPWPEWAVIGALLGYILIGAVLYFAYVQPWIAGEIDVRIGADSDRYWEAVRLQQQGGSQSLISLSGNLLGPILEARLLNDGFLVLCCNAALLYIAMKVVGSIPHVNKVRFGFLVAMCPALLPAVATLNKEIFALLAAVVTAKYLYSEQRSKLLLFTALALSLFARWEQAAIILLSLALSHGIFKGRPKLAITALVFGIAVAYPLAFAILGIDITAFDWLLQGGNTIVKLDAIQMAYGFPIVFIPKSIMVVAGLLLAPSFFFSANIFNAIAHDPQQALFQPIACLAFIVVIVLLVATKRASLHNPVVFLSVVTLIVTAASPFIQSRYIYGAYIMLCIELSRPRYLNSRPFLEREMPSRLPRVRRNLLAAQPGSPTP